MSGLAEISPLQCSQQPHMYFQPLQTIPGAAVLMKPSQLLAVLHLPEEKKHPHLLLLITSGDLFLFQWRDVLEHQQGCQWEEEESACCMPTAQLRHKSASRASSTSPPEQVAC